jgi:hypothetical protein
MGQVTSASRLKANKLSEALYAPARPVTAECDARSAFARAFGGQAGWALVRPRAAERAGKWNSRKRMQKEKQKSPD